MYVKLDWVYEYDVWTVWSIECPYYLKYCELWTDINASNDIISRILHFWKREKGWRIEFCIPKKSGILIAQLKEVEIFFYDHVKVSGKTFP